MAIQVVFEAVDKAALATLQKVAKGVDGVTEAEKRNKKETHHPRNTIRVEELSPDP